MRKSVLFITAVAAFSIMTLSAISLALSYGGEAETLAQLSAQENHARAAEPPRVSTPTPRPEAPEPTPAPDPLVPTEAAYVVRAQGGQVAVYRADAPDVAVEITDIRVASLREFDQRQLEQGIPVQGEEALARLLEDFAP
jgi:hypothetical protein